MGTLSLNASGLTVILAPRCGKNNVFLQYGLKFYIKMLAALQSRSTFLGWVPVSTKQQRLPNVAPASKRLTCVFTLLVSLLASLLAVLLPCFLASFLPCFLASLLPCLFFLVSSLLFFIVPCFLVCFLASVVPCFLVSFDCFLFPCFFASLFPCLLACFLASVRLLVPSLLTCLLAFSCTPKPEKIACLAWIYFIPREKYNAEIQQPAKRDCTAKMEGARALSAKQGDRDQFLLLGL